MFWQCRNAATPDAWTSNQRSGRFRVWPFASFAALLFLDHLIPSVFGKPLLSDKPEVSQIAWHRPCYRVRRGPL